MKTSGYISELHFHKGTVYIYIDESISNKIYGT